MTALGNDLSGPLTAAPGTVFAHYRELIRLRHELPVLADGDFTPYINDGVDGYDLIEWVAEQPWCDGNVIYRGASYGARTGWMVALEHPPHLKAMVPAMTYATPESFWYAGGVWDGSWLDWTWWNTTTGAT